MSAQFTEHDLAQFGGSEQFYRHWTGRLIYTEGCHFLCEHGAGWLIDAIASYQGTAALRQHGLQDFQLWTLEVNLSFKSGVLTCRPDSDRDAAVTQNIEFTDFPLPSIKLYVERGEELTLMLPSER